jgi:hypothetical protein
MKIFQKLQPKNFISYLQIYVKKINIAIKTFSVFVTFSTLKTLDVLDIQMKTITNY